MLEIIGTIVMIVGVAIAAALVIGLWVLCLYLVNQEANTLFKHRSNDRFANKLFKKIEEYRNDFA